MNKAACFLIDYQKDFMDQPNAALPVTGATADAKRVATWLTKFAPELDAVYLTQDSHHVLDIAHPCWWKKADGTPVDPFTPILPEDIASGKFYAAVHPRLSNQYIRDLTAQGEFGHFIWPEHCIIGTEGHAFQEDIQKAVAHYERTTHRWVNVITKGSNPFTEHFGAFRANIPQPSDPSTQPDQNLLAALGNYDTLFFTGEARSHCVANSLRQLCDEAPNVLPKLVILTDGMSDVQGLPQSFYDGVDAIYARAKSMGARFMKTTDFSNTLYI